MHYSNLLLCLASLLASFPANADTVFSANSSGGAETLEDVATGIRERFPRIEISGFTCAGATCSKEINLSTFSAMIVVTMDAADRPVAIAAVIRPPMLDSAFSACADAIVSIAAPDMPPDQRADFANRAMGSQDAGIRNGEWTFFSPAASEVRIFQARR